MRAVMIQRIEIQQLAWDAHTLRERLEIRGCRRG